MKIFIAGLSIIAVAAVSVVLYFVPLSTPREVCSSVMQWTGVGEGLGRLSHPMDLTWDSGFLYVADTENGAIRKFADDGSLVAEWTGFGRPVDVAAARGFVYVADFLTDRISKLRTDGTFVAEWGSHGSGDGEFDAPSGIAVNSDDNVYVADFYNHRIQQFTGDGEFVMQWGGNGRWNGQFHYPTDVAINSGGEVFVADAYNHRVQKFTPQGVYLDKWGGLGYGMSGKWSGWFRLAKAVAVDSVGNVYVADAFNHRVQKFNGDGEFVGVWRISAPGEGNIVQYPAGIAAGADGAIYVSDFFKNQVWKLDCG